MLVADWPTTNSGSIYSNKYTQDQITPDGQIVSVDKTLQLVTDGLR